MAVRSLKSSSDEQFKIKAVHSSDGQIIFDMRCSKTGHFRAYWGEGSSTYEIPIGYRSLWLD